MSVRSRLRLALRRRALLVAVLAGLGTPAGATLFVPPDDATLAAGAAAIVEATVAAVEPAPGDRAATDVLVEVATVVKGFVPGTALIVRTPGGVLADGTVLRVGGAPRFRAGERVLLFLDPRADGTFAVHGLFLGAFHVVTAADGLPLAVRDDGRTTMDEKGRDLAAFRRWLADRAAGVIRPPDYLVAATTRSKFRTVVSSREPPPVGCGEDGGVEARWFAFDHGGSVPFFPFAAGQPGLADGGRAALAAALAAWSGVDGASVRVVRGEPSLDAGQGLRAPDGHSSVLFADPDDDLAGSFAETGILATTALWFRCERRDYGRDPFHEVIEADVVTQDGIEAFFAASPDPAAAAAELLAHELGHALGLADSEIAEALMARVHDDGRGATLGPDDALGLHHLYGPARPPTVPEDPTQLFAAPLSSTSARLLWQDNASDETAYRLDVRVGGGPPVEVPVPLPPDTRAAEVVGLEPGMTVGFRVRAVNKAGSSRATNEVVLTTFADDSCVVGPRRLCLDGGRFRVEAAFRDPHREVRRPATAVPLTADSGLFWFFGPENVEAAVRVERDEATGTVKVELARLTTVEHRITVVDLATGAAAVYDRPADALCGLADPDAFGTAAAAVPALPAVARRVPPALAVRPIAPPAYLATKVHEPSGDPGGCVRGPTSLCLTGGRFRLEAEELGPLTTLAATGLVRDDATALLTFDDPERLRAVVKLVDARTLDGHFWLFHAPLGETAYRATVTDLETGEERTVETPAALCGGADTGTFEE